MRGEDVFNALSMVPGIALSYVWIRESDYPYNISMYGYIVTCACSITFHLAKAYYGSSMHQRWLRIDLIGQNVGLICGGSQTRLGYSSVLMVLPLSIVCLVANLDNPKEKQLAFVANFINILITYSYKLELVAQWFIAVMFFALDDFIPSYGVGHTVWHLMCHVILRQSFQHITSII
jgi:hypothetical protein